MTHSVSVNYSRGQTGLSTNTNMVEKRNDSGTQGGLRQQMFGVQGVNVCERPEQPFWFWEMAVGDLRVWFWSYSTS